MPRVPAAFDDGVSVDAVERPARLRRRPGRLHNAAPTPLARNARMHRHPLRTTPGVTATA